MDTSHSVLRSAKRFLAGTFLSRFSGLFRDIAMAITFGSAPEVAAFMVSFRLANLFRRLLGEGNFQAGFVPHFEELNAQNPEKALHFFRDVSFSLAIILLCVVLVLEGILGGLLFIIPNDWIEIARLCMWMVPGLFFICLYALNSSFLQCRKKYFLPAVAPIGFNFVWIFAVLGLGHFPRLEAMRLLSISITVAFGAQWLITIFEGLRIIPLKIWLTPKIFSTDWKALLKPLMLGIVGIGAVQFNSALDAIFARLADLEGPSFLWYAIRVQQLPMALFGIALSGALLPPLSRAIANNQIDLYRELLESALRLCSALMVPCTFGIFALAAPGLNLLFGHGDFFPLSVRQTVYCLWGYGIGLLPSVFVLLLAAGFYAKKSYRTPTLASLFSVMINIFLNTLFVFIFEWGAVSIALSTSISSIFNVLILSRRLPLKFIFKTILISAPPSLLTLLLGNLWMGSEYTRSFPTQMLQFSVLSSIYLGGVALLAWRLKVTEIWDLFRRKKPILIRE